VVKKLMRPCARSILGARQVVHGVASKVAQLAQNAQA
jgi:hypothetical protein